MLRRGALRDVVDPTWTMPVRLRVSGGTSILKKGLSDEDFALSIADAVRLNASASALSIFGDQDTPSGLWSEVGPRRARSRGMREEDLADYYRDRNLLKARVCGHHMGNAVVFFASNATPTTGATLPVDGGVVEAFPR